MEGNEKADDLAKRAITDGGSNTDDLPKFLRKELPHSKSAAKYKQAYGEKLKQRESTGMGEITPLHTDEEHGPVSMLREIHQTRYQGS